MASLSTQPVKVVPSILVWARESMGLSYADVAKQINKGEDLVKEWESGKVLPTYSQLEKLADDVYKRPLVVFFLPEPPRETTPKQDFRTLADTDASALPPALRLMVRKAKHHQVALRELYPGGNPAEDQIHKTLSFELSLDARNAAARVRKYLDLPKDARKAFARKGDAFSDYRAVVEGKGVFVFQHPMKEIRGISLMDKEFPVIVVNSSDAPTAKVFTLFHELCHILFNTGGVFRDSITEELKMDSHSVERFCNEFASEFLVPSEEMRAILQHVHQLGPEWEEQDIRRIAAHFNVSKEVILRRLLDMELTDGRHYKKLVSRWNEQNAKFKEEQKKKTGGPPYQTQVISQLGKRFIYEVLSKYHAGTIDLSKASNFLGVKLNQIPKIEAKLS